MQETCGAATWTALTHDEHADGTSDCLQWRAQPITAGAAAAAFYRCVALCAPFTKPWLCRQVRTTQDDFWLLV